MSVTGGTVTSYTWGVASGPGEIVSGQGTATALTRTYDEAGDFTPTVSEFFCDVVIAGVIYRAFCTFQHENTGDIIYDGIGLIP
jgi:hypothetical protein